jgi:transcriptional regulator with XRE-family HTH domain
MQGIIDSIWDLLAGAGLGTHDKCPVSLLSLSYSFLVINSAQGCSGVCSDAAEGCTVNIGERLRALREEKKLSQGDVEERTGLLRSYISRAENGHTVPAVETLEKFARALEVPMYQLFYDGEEPPKPKDLPRRKAESKRFGASGKDARMLDKLRMFLSQTDAKDKGILMHMAEQMARRKAV